jgi:hypothetical protein
MFAAIHFVFEAALHALKRIFRIKLTPEERRRLEKEESRAGRRMLTVTVATFVAGGILLFLLMRYLDGISK